MLPQAGRGQEKQGSSFLTGSAKNKIMTFFLNNSVIDVKKIVVVPGSSGTRKFFFQIALFSQKVTLNTH